MLSKTLFSIHRAVGQHPLQHRLGVLGQQAIRGEQLDPSQLSPALARRWRIDTGTAGRRPRAGQRGYPRAARADACRAIAIG